MSWLKVIEKAFPAAPAAHSLGNYLRAWTFFMHIRIHVVPYQAAVGYLWVRGGGGGGEVTVHLSGQHKQVGHTMPCTAGHSLFRVIIIVCLCRTPTEPHFTHTGEPLCECIAAALPASLSWPNLHPCSSLETHAAKPHVGVLFSIRKKLARKVVTSVAD